MAQARPQKPPSVVAYQAFFNMQDGSDNIKQSLLYHRMVTLYIWHSMASTEDTDKLAQQAATGLYWSLVEA